MMSLATRGTSVELCGCSDGISKLVMSELCRSSDRRLSAKSVPTFAGRGSHVVSVTDPYCRILRISRLGNEQMDLVNQLLRLTASVAFVM
jgi:hypothetical protein